MGKVAAATAIQAAWRGCCSRRSAKALLHHHRKRQVCLAQLRSAIAGRDLQRVRQAATQLEALSCGADAAQAVARFEQQAAEAAEALRQAAAAGDAQAYQAAAEAATLYGHLEAAAGQAAATFASRLVAAKQAVLQAAEEEPEVQFRGALAAAQALGAEASFLLLAQQRIAERNEHAAAALQAATEAAPFSTQAFDRRLQQAQRLGLLADAARAEQALQLRRHRAADALRQLSDAGSVASSSEIGAACQEAAHLGLAAEAEAAFARLEQRQAAATEALRQAAHRGSLLQYETAAAAAVALGVSSHMQQACRAQLLARQQQAQQRLHQAAHCEDLPAIRQCCEAALQLGLSAAVQAAEQHVNERRANAAEQLAASTRSACDFATLQARAAGAPSAQQDDHLQQQLQLWLRDVQQIEQAAVNRGAAAALAQPPPACLGWPMELRGWLVDTHRAAALGLERPVASAIAALQTHVAALLAAAQELPRLQLGGSEGGAMPGSHAAIPPDAVRLLACLEEWRSMQQEALPLVAALAMQDGGRCGGPDAPAEQASCGTGCAAAGMDLSRRGLRSLDLLAGCTSLSRLDVSANALTRQVASS